MLGMHGSAYANYAVQECDCLIAVGARFDDRVTGNLATFAPHAKIIHIDIDPSSISKNVDVDVRRRSATPGTSLELMLQYIEHRDRKEWFSQINAWKKRYPFKYFDDTQERQAAVRDRGDCTARPTATRSSPPASASTRCGPPSSTAGATPAR